MINKIRELRAEEIEVRPAHKVKDKIGMLLYIDSRAVTNYLDEWVGCMNWQTEFYEVNNQIIGKLGIWDEVKQMWVWKSDVGSESNIEKEKGLISDTYKRLLSRWGVTYLYTAPDIVLDDDGYGNKGYRVSEIKYENKRIIHLVITNRFGKEVFRWDMGDKSPKTTPQVNNPHTPIDDDLEWKPETNVVKVQMTKQLTPVEQLTNWYNTIEHNPVIDKFYSYWFKRLSENEWTGKFNLNSLIEKYCK